MGQGVAIILIFFLLTLAANAYFLRKIYLILAANYDPNPHSFFTKFSKNDGFFEENEADMNFIQSLGLQFNQIKFEVDDLFIKKCVIYYKKHISNQPKNLELREIFFKISRRSKQIAINLEVKHLNLKRAQCIYLKNRNPVAYVTEMDRIPAIERRLEEFRKIYDLEIRKDISEFYEGNLIIDLDEFD